MISHNIYIYYIYIFLIILIYFPQFSPWKRPSPWGVHPKIKFSRPWCERSKRTMQLGCLDDKKTSMKLMMAIIVIYIYIYTMIHTVIFMCIYIYCIDMYMYVYMCRYINVYIYVCIYVYIIHMSIHVYVYTLMWNSWGYKGQFWINLMMTSRREGTWMMRVGLGAIIP